MGHSIETKKVSQEEKGKQVMPLTPPPQINIASIDKDSDDNNNADDTDDDDGNEKYLSMHSSISSLSSTDKGPRQCPEHVSPTKPLSELANIDLDDDDVHHHHTNNKDHDW